MTAIPTYPVTLVPTYLVTLTITKKIDEDTVLVGGGSIEVPTFGGAAAAGKRAKWAAIAAGWGDVDEVEVKSVELLTGVTL